MCTANIMEYISASLYCRTWYQRHHRSNCPDPWVLFSSSFANLAKMQLKYVFSTVFVKLDGSNYMLSGHSSFPPCMACASLAMSVAHSHAQWSIWLLSLQLLLQPTMIRLIISNHLNPEYIAWQEESDSWLDPFFSHRECSCRSYWIHDFKHDLSNIT